MEGWNLLSLGLICFIGINAFVIAYIYLRIPNGKLRWILLCNHATIGFVCVGSVLYLLFDKYLEMPMWLFTVIIFPAAVGTSMYAHHIFWNYFMKR